MDKHHFLFKKELLDEYGMADETYYQLCYGTRQNYEIVQEGSNLDHMLDEVKRLNVGYELEKALERLEVFKELAKEMAIRLQPINEYGTHMPTNNAIHELIRRTNIELKK